MPVIMQTLVCCHSKGNAAEVPKISSVKYLVMLSNKHPSQLVFKSSAQRGALSMHALLVSNH